MLNSDLDRQLRFALIALEADARAVHALVEEIAQLVNDTCERNLLTMNGSAFTPVLSADELAYVERTIRRGWMSAKSVWLVVRAAEPYEHSVSIRLGKQLSAQYPKQKRQGATRMYWIESQAIAPKSE